jgi:MFS family permease
MMVAAESASALSQTMLFTFGVFLKPVSREFSWNGAANSAASGVATLMVAITVPLIGTLVDRWGVRRCSCRASCGSRSALPRSRWRGIAARVRRALCHRRVFAAPAGGLRQSDLARGAV